MCKHKFLMLTFSSTSPVKYLKEEPCTGVIRNRKWPPSLHFPRNCGPSCGLPRFIKWIMLSLGSGGQFRSSASVNCSRGVFKMKINILPGVCTGHSYFHVSPCSSPDKSRCGIEHRWIKYFLGRATITPPRPLSLVRPGLWSLKAGST